MITLLYKGALFHIVSCIRGSSCWMCDLGGASEVLQVLRPLQSQLLQLAQRVSAWPDTCWEACEAAPGGVGAMVATISGDMQENECEGAEIDDTTIFEIMIVMLLKGAQAGRMVLSAVLQVLGGGVTLPTTKKAADQLRYHKSVRTKDAELGLGLPCAHVIFLESLKGAKLLRMHLMTASEERLPRKGQELTSKLLISSNEKYLEEAICMWLLAQGMDWTRGVPARCAVEGRAVNIAKKLRTTKWGSWQRFYEFQTVC